MVGQVVGGQMAGLSWRGFAIGRLAEGFVATAAVTFASVAMMTAPAMISQASAQSFTYGASRPTRRDHLRWPCRLELQNQLRRLIIWRCWSPPTATSNLEGNRLRSRLHMENMK